MAESLICSYQVDLKNYYIDIIGSAGIERLRQGHSLETKLKQMDGAELETRVVLVYSPNASQYVVIFSPGENAINLQRIFLSITTEQLDKILTEKTERITVGKKSLEIHLTD
jgi:hypothetical protein